MKVYVNGFPLLTDTNQLLDLQSSVIDISQQADANNLSNGNYRLNNDLPANVPSDCHYGLLTCIKVAPNWMLQFCISLDAKIYKRAQINGQWTNWTKTE